MILRADARAIPLRDESVDSIVTDPPYELGFMGKKWDSSGVAYSVDVWAEALRVLKPGGHLLAFGGSRTHHRLFCAVEDAGFEIRDTVCWLFGSGFPKSLDVSKAIDKAAGAEREVAGRYASPEGTSGDKGHTDFATRRPSPGLPIITAPATDSSRQWSGWGTALKPAAEYIVMARKPLGESTVATNVLAHGTGAINVDGCRVEGTPRTTHADGNIRTKTNGPTMREGFGIGERPAPAARWPANVIHDGSEEVVGMFDEQGKRAGVHGAGHQRGNRPGNYQGGSPVDFGGIGYGRAGFRVGDSGSAARFFYCAKASREDREWALEGMEEREAQSTRWSGDGMPRRQDGTERKMPKARNHHPTVKPLDLMRYLCRLVTPPGGIVLDPFAGSGSTLRGAFLEGFKPIGIELDAEYCRIARGRMNLLTPAMAGLMG